MKPVTNTTKEIMESSKDELWKAGDVAGAILALRGTAFVWPQGVAIPPSMPMLVTVQDRQEMLVALGKAFLPESIKSRSVGGNKMASYIDGATCIRRLNDSCKYGWDLECLETRENQEKGKRVVEVKVRLTIWGLGSREHFGIQEMQGGADMVKGAITDALKKAASLFLVGIELYGEDFEQPSRDKEAKAQLKIKMDKAIDVVFGPLKDPWYKPNDFFMTWLYNHCEIETLRGADLSVIKSIVGRLESNPDGIRSIMQAESKDWDRPEQGPELPKADRPQAPAPKAPTQAPAPAQTAKQAAPPVQEFPSSRKASAANGEQANEHDEELDDPFADD